MMVRIDSRSCFVAAAIATAALAACAGSGASPSSPASRGTASGDRTQTTFVVHWPSAQQAPNVRRHDALSPSTQSIAISVNGGAPYVSNKPLVTGSPASTSVSINAPIGTDSFSFVAYDLPGGTGNVLDQATASQDIIANANNSVGVTLDGVCAALLPSLTSSTPSPFLQAHMINAPLSSGATIPLLNSIRLEGPFSQTISVTQVDADGNTIVNSAGSVPISLTESGSVPHFSITAIATSAGNNKFTLTPLGPEPDGLSSTITASSPNCGTGTPIFPNSFVISTSAVIYVADSNAGILAFDQDGNQLATLSSTKNITGLTYNPTSSTLTAIEPLPSAAPGIAFQTLSLSGSSLASGTLPVPSSDGNPVGNIAYNAANGYYLVALGEYTNASGNTQYGSVLEYSISGATATSVKPSGTNPFQTSSSTPPPYDPVGFAVLPSGNVLVEDLDASSNYFDKNGNYLNSSASSSQTVTLDTLRQNLLQFDGDSYIYVTNASGLELGSAFTTRIPLQSGNGYSSATTYTASAYVPNIDELYGFGVYGSFAFPAALLTPEANTYNPPSLLPVGAFSALTAPTQAVVVP